MKKTVKALVVAASVAAIVGIGAVSFAKWAGSTEATTNAVSTPEFTAGSLTVTTQPTLKLIPYDQDGALAAAATGASATNTFMWTVKLTLPATSENYKNMSVTHNHEFKETAASAGDAGNFYFKYVVQDSSAAAPTAPTKPTDSSGLSDWRPMEAKDVAKNFLDTGSDSFLDESKSQDIYVYIIMDSSNCNASGTYAGDAGLTDVTFTFNLLV